MGLKVKTVFGGERAKSRQRSCRDLARSPPKTVETFSPMLQTTRAPSRPCANLFVFNHSLFACSGHLAFLQHIWVKSSSSNEKHSGLSREMGKDVLNAEHFWDDREMEGFYGSLSTNSNKILKAANDAQQVKFKCFWLKCTLGTLWPANVYPSLAKLYPSCYQIQSVLNIFL